MKAAKRAKPGFTPKGRSERGQSLVEFALVLPIFLVLVLGIIDFGLGLKSWITITNAAREGARYAAVTCGEVSDDTEVIAKTEDAAADEQEPETGTRLKAPRRHAGTEQRRVDT